MTRIKQIHLAGFIFVICSCFTIYFFIFRVYFTNKMKYIPKTDTFKNEQLDKRLRVGKTESNETTKISAEDTIKTDKDKIKTDISMIKSDIKAMKADINKIKSTFKAIKSHKNMTMNSTRVERNWIDSKNRTIWASPPPGTLLSRRQIAAITNVLQRSGNLLVWGLGNDSPFWHDSTKGKVFFIEPKGLWFEKITGRYQFLKVLSVNYTTDLNKTYDKYINDSSIWCDLDLRPQLPSFVSKTTWNVILVDAPPGFGNGPGRYQSIYTSSLIAKNQTHIFVDDYQRKIEGHFSRKMLGTPVEVIERQDAKNSTSENKLAHFTHVHT